MKIIIRIKDTKEEFIIHPYRFVECLCNNGIIKQKRDGKVYEFSFRYRFCRIFLESNPEKKWRRKFSYTLIL